ncbi:hypothetical protein [Streptomyces sp. NPDC093260]|uniref:hypothetical protein n=1 Tax=Streptomyces sp. NPDC093260 TaxID=3155073 RepID=UPI0034330BC4
MRNRLALVGTAVVGAVLLAGGTTTAVQAAPAPTHGASAGASANVANEAPDWTPSNAPAGALSCGAKPTTNGYGGATVTKSIYLRTGPSSACDDIFPKLLVGQRLGGWCYYDNPAGNRWYYVSTGGAAPYGWIYDGNVTEGNTIKTKCNAW